MDRTLIGSVVVSVFAALVTSPAYCQLQKAPAKGTALRKALEQKQQQLEQQGQGLAKEESSLQAERRSVGSLKRELREAMSDVAREKRNSRKWVCNAYNTEHNDPSECTRPQDGGVWITKPNPNIASAQQRVQDLQAALASAERQYDVDLQSFNSEVAKFKADVREFSSQMNRAGFGNRPQLLSADTSSVRDYTTAVAERAWTRTGNTAVKNLKSDADLSAELDKAIAGSNYLKAGDLKVIVAIESSANRNTGVNKYGYAGLFQMGPKAAKEVGYDYNKLKNPSDWKTNVEAGTKYLESNAEQLAKKNLPVTPLNIYLAHQQGANGAASILQVVQDGSAPTTAANKNMLANLPSSYVNSITRLGKKVTIQNYYDYWTDTFSAVNSVLNGSGNTPLP